MSLYDYEMSKVIGAKDYPLYALIMAAMRQADIENLGRLRAAFPNTYGEMRARYGAPAGRLLTDGNEVVVIQQDDYERGVEHGLSRARSRPGDGDMGG